MRTVGGYRFNARRLGALSSRLVFVPSLLLSVLLLPRLAQGTPYATEITSTGFSISFRLNEAADNVKVITDNGTVTHDLDNLPAGLFTASISTTGAFQVVVSKNTSGPISQIGTNIPFGSPRGVAVNVNPTSPYFGRVYVSNGATNTANKGDGIFIFNSDLSDTFGQGNVPRTGGTTNFASSANSPYRIKVGHDDGQLYICDFSDATGNLYVTGPNVGSNSLQYALKPFTTNGFGTNATAIVPVGTNNNHGSLEAVEVTGSLSAGNLKIFTLDEDYQTNTTVTNLTQLNSLWEYDVSAASLPWSNAPNARLLTPTINFASQTMDLARGTNGYFYVSDNRILGNEAGVFVVNSSGTLLFNSHDESVAEGYANDLLSNTVAIAVSEDGRYLAAAKTNNVITIVPLTNGIPNLPQRFQYTGFTNLSTARALAFDAADNLYFVSSGTLALSVLSLGYPAVAITTSDGAFSLSIGPPRITAQPQDSANLIGGTATLRVAAEGSPTLAYRWLFNGIPLSGTGATAAALTINNLQSSNLGPYQVIITNAYGSVTSQVATLIPLGGTGYQLSLLWSVSPTNGQPWMNDQNAINPNQRTMAYNSLSNHLYVISRNSNIGSNYNIYVLNPNNGALLYTLRTNGIFNAGAVGSAGIGLDGIGVADDGAIYACNMAPNASGSNGLDATSLFRVYRWANGNSNTTPVTVFTGDPSGTNGVLRWGDNLTVRGSGTNTQILVDSNTRLASNTVRYAAVLSPVNQGLTNFTAKWFITTNSGTAIGKSLEFDGANNNLWQKASLSALVKSSFDPTTLVGSNQIAATTLAVYNGFSVRVCGVGLDQTRGLAAGVEIPVPSVPDTLDLYSITNLNAPVLLSQVAFPTSPHNVNTSFISQTFFAGDKLFTLDANNGIMVFSVAPLSYNVVVPPSQKLLIANQLDHGNNTLDEVLPSVPDGTQVQKYNCDGSYTTYTRSAGAWNPAGATLMPGEGAFLVNNSGAALTNTFTGIPHTPVLPPNLPCGCGNYNLLSCQTNTMGTWENIMGFPPGDGAVVLTYNNGFTANAYDTDLGDWTLGAPALAVGQSALFGTRPCPTPPVIACPTNRMVECGSAWNFDALTNIVANCFTNFYTVTFSTVTNLGSCPLLVATRTWLVKDICGNSNSCSQTITVVDTTPPVITCASNKTVQCGSAWSFDNPTATDACSGTNVTITILSTSTNPLVGGTFLAKRIWTIADPCTNIVTCTQTVTTVDTTAPVIVCPGNITAAEFPYNSGHAIVTFPGPTLSDCDPSPITNSSPASGTFFPLGTNLVTWTAADHSGNSNSCAFTIRVIPYQLVVTSTNNSGPGTLRQALLDANDAPGENLILFSLAGSGGHKIHLLSALPSVTSPVIIDGWSQPGFAGLPVIELEGTSNSFDGLVIGAGSSTVRGLALHGFANGLRLETNGNNVIQGNFIGTDLSGTNPAPNSANGISLASGTANNFIGGTISGTGNLIAFNGTRGIGLSVSAGSGNAILGNSIFANASLGIDLGNNGVTLNDPGDTDTGPNNYQNFPVLTDAQSENGMTTISGTLNSAANTDFQLDFFLNDSADPSGYGEGQTYLGSATVTTDGNGSNVFSVAFAANAAFTQFITATATDPANNTSEFSQAKQLRTPPVIVAPPTSVTNVSAGTNVTFAVGATNSSQAAQFIYQWRLNGFNIAGATSTSYTTPPAGVTNAGTYTVVVQNDVGAVSVPPVVLTLNVTNVAGADNFANRVPVSGASGTLASNNRNATTQPGEPRHAGKLGGKSVWYTWEAPFNGVATFETRGSTFDTLLAVYTGTVVSNLSVVAYDEDRGGFYTSKVRFNANAGAQYQIAVDGFAGTEGDFVLAWSEENTPHPLPTFLVQPVSQTVGQGSNATFSATADPIPSLSYQWYFYGLPIAGATTTSLTINNVQFTNAGIYTLLLTTPWETNQSDDASLQINISDSTVQNALAYDKFEDATNAAVMMNITIPIQTGPGSSGKGGHPGGPLDAAPAVVTGIIGFGTVSDGTDAAKGETLCGVIGGASSWCPLPPLARAYSGQLYLNTDGSTFNTLLAVAYASQANILTCDTNSRAGMGVGGTATSAVQVPVRANDNNNFIGVDGVGGASGSCTIHWMLFPAPTLSFLGRTPAGNNHLQVLGQTGQSNLHFAIQVSTDFVHWSSLLSITTNSPTNLFDWTDTNSTRFVQRFYRASMLP